MKNIVFVLLMLGVCGIGGAKFYIPKLIDSRIRFQINNAITTIQKQQNEVITLVKNLESKLQQLKNLSDERKFVPNFKIDFNRWNCWCDLRKKLIHGEKCSVELAKFRDEFSNCPDLLKMVDSIVVNEDSGMRDDSLIKNLLKFVKIHSVNEDELERVSGYVLLLSVRKEMAYE